MRFYDKTQKLSSSQDICHGWCTICYLGLSASSKLCWIYLSPTTLETISNISLISVSEGLKHVGLGISWFLKPVFEKKLTDFWCVTQAVCLHRRLPHCRLPSSRTARTFLHRRCKNKAFKISWIPRRPGQKWAFGARAVRDTRTCCCSRSRGSPASWP